jgi:hypothetical protein
MKQEKRYLFYKKRPLDIQHVKDNLVLSYKEHKTGVANKQQLPILHFIKINPVMVLRISDNSIKILFAYYPPKMVRPT